MQGYRTLILQIVTLVLAAVVAFGGVDLPEDSAETITAGIMAVLAVLNTYFRWITTTEMFVAPSRFSRVNKS